MLEIFFWILIIGIINKIFFKNKSSNIQSFSSKNNNGYSDTLNNKYSIEASIKKYHTDTITQRCRCKDWKLTRNTYNYNDPRRLCKHLIYLLNIESLDEDLNFFKDNLGYYKSKEMGYKNKSYEFETIIRLNEYKLEINYNNIWMNLYTKEGLKYGILFDEHSNFYWSTKYEKPNDYKEIELKLFDILYEHIIYLTHSETQQIRELVPTFIENITLQEKEENFLKYCINCKYDDFYDDYKFTNSDILDFHSIKVNNYEIILNLKSKTHILKRNFSTNKMDADDRKNIHRNELIETQKRLEIIEAQDREKEQIRLLKLEEMQLKGYVLRQSNHNYDVEQYISLQNIFFSKYIKTSDLAKRIGIPSVRINKELQKLNYLVKTDDYNNGKYILINNGLRYGINYAINSTFSQITIPKWYITHHINTKKMIFEQNGSQDLVPFTEVYFNIDYVDVLHKIIVESMNKKEFENLDNKNKAPKELSEKEKLRELWLSDKICFKCGSQNLHKKGQRKANGKNYQRYQCMDCNAMYKEEFE